MAAPLSQRIAIWIIAAMMAIGSIGFYFLIIIDNNDRAAMQAQFQQQLSEVQAEEAKPKTALPGYKATSFKAKDVKELKAEDLKEGTGKTVKRGDDLKLNYMGWLPDGTIFDSTAREGKPTPIELSLNQVIKGWQDGVPGMKEGGVRKLIIPAEQAYGKAGSGSIPPDTPLVFIVEVVSVKG